MTPLFPYQEAGAAWLSERRFAILGDQPRVGKTAQAIRAADQLGGRVAIVCPAVAIGVWQAAIARFGQGKFKSNIRSYNIAARDGLPKADIYIFDEAHRLKNIAAERTKRLLGLSSPARQGVVWALSGTIAPNHAGELFTWLRFAGLWASGYQAFLNRFCNVIQGPYGPKIMGNKPAALPELKAMLDPVMLRRTRAEVFADQPKAIWGDILLQASGVGTCSTLSNSALQVDEMPDAFDVEQATLRRLTGEVKAGPLADFLASEIDDSGEKVAVYAWHKSVLDILEERLGKQGLVRVDGSTLAGKRTARVAAFTDDPKIKVFLGQTVAAGEAVDLSVCGSLVAAELSWNPSENAQAFARLAGPNQTAATLIRTTTLAGSLDESVNGVLTRKTRGLMELYSH